MKSAQSFNSAEYFSLIYFGPLHRALLPACGPLFPLALLRTAPSLAQHAESTNKMVLRKPYRQIDPFRNIGNAILQLDAFGEQIR